MRLMIGKDENCAERINAAVLRYDESASSEGLRAGLCRAFQIIPELERLTRGGRVTGYDAAPTIQPLKPLIPPPVISICEEPVWLLSISW